MCITRNAFSSRLCLKRHDNNVHKKRKITNVTLNAAKNLSSVCMFVCLKLNSTLMDQKPLTGTDIKYRHCE